MSHDNMLSQEEIDALLNIPEDKTNDEVTSHLSGVEVDAIGEIGNISFGSAATALSELLKQKVEITTPTVSVVKRNRLDAEFPVPHVGVFVQYTEGFEGSNVLVIMENDAKIIADLMLGGDGAYPTGEISEMELSAVQEAMNQMMGSASTSMSAVFNKRIDISPPSIDMVDFRDDQVIKNFPGDDELLKVSFNIKIGSLIDSNIMQLLPINFSKQLVAELIDRGESGEAAGDQQQAESSSRPSETRHDKQQVENIDEPLQPAIESQHLGSAFCRDEKKANIQSAMFSDFEEADESNTGTQNLNMLFDIPLQVTVELGRAKRTVRDILRLTPGSVIELNKLAGEPVDIFVNNKMIARGEVVVIDENFGVRVTEIASKTDRIQKLQ